MEILTGKYTKAKIYTAGELEPYARAQLQMLCDNECLAGSRVRVMPDVHPGKVGTIGLTMTVGEHLMPFLTGIDIPRYHTPSVPWKPPQRGKASLPTTKAAR